MKQIVTKPHRSLLYVLQGQNYNYSALYRSLEKCLGADIECFAKYADDGTHAIWSSSINGDLEALGSFEDDELVELKKQLRIKLGNVKFKLQGTQLESIGDKLLTVPNDDAIYVSKNGEETKFILTQWGCKTLGLETPTFEPVPIESIGPTFVNVRVELKYSDNSSFSEESFLFINQEIEKELETDKEGFFEIGKMRVGTPITIAKQLKTELFSETIVIEADKREYTVVVPMYASADIRVINQLDEPIEGFSIQLSAAGKQYPGTTDARGHVLIDPVRIDGLQVTVASEAGSHKQSFDMTKGENHFVFKIQDQISSDAAIHVVDENGNYVYDYAILVNGDTHSTKSSGVIDIYNQEVNSTLYIQDSIEPRNEMRRQLLERKNNITFQVERPPEPMVEVSIVNF